MSETFLGFRNEMTKYMDSHVNESDKCKGFYVYILEGKDGKPSTFESDNEYGWYVRYPGYTCANVFFSKKDNTVLEIKLTRRGGGFSGGHETVFDDYKKLQKDLNEMFVGKTMDYVTDKFDRENTDEFEEL